MNNTMFSLIKSVKAISEQMIINPKSADDFFEDFCDAKPVYTALSYADIYEGRDAITEYVKSFREYYDECDDNRIIIGRLAETICGQYRRSVQPIISTAAIGEIMDMVMRVFPDLNSVISTPIEILLIDAQAKGRNAETSIINMDNYIQSIIRMYRISNSCPYTPEQVLLHELGHLLHMNGTKTTGTLPESFREYLLSIGAHPQGSTDRELLEVFADTLLIAFTAKCNVVGDPFPEIAPATKQKCYEYINWYIQNMR